jgi:peptidoglycan/LPS O-acetylase OafA/YrhL
MGPGLSLYLDLLRFGMAATVALGHMAAGFFGDHNHLWFLPPYMQTAVTGFFVLSGFVIAYVTDRTERRGWDYGAARGARLYSVIVPAMILTFALDAVGTRLDHGFYAAPEMGLHLFGGDEPARYLATLFMVGSTWFAGPDHLSPGSDGPFWTMSYEAAYYALFGVVLFARGKPRIVGLASIALIAGPEILILLPVWMAGVATYCATKRWRLPKWWAALLFLASLVFLEKIGWARHVYFGDMPLNTNTAFRYSEGAAVALNIFAAASLEPFVGAVLAPMARVVRWLGELTFPLYLSHLPTLCFLAAVAGPARRATAPYNFTIALIVFLVAAGMTVLGNRLRGEIRKALTGLRPNAIAGPGQ